MRAAVIKFETELPLCVCLGTPGFLHALAELDEHNIVPAGCLLCRAVGDGACQGLSGSASRPKEADQQNRFGERPAPRSRTADQIVPLPSRFDRAASSSLAISARIPAASSSRDNFIDW